MPYCKFICNLGETNVKLNKDGCPQKQDFFYFNGSSILTSC